ncbi:glycosyltransferase family 4 protein [Candidatus Woesebacteria bacterium]|nr:MAG: glycosyltransferase family 4 protein [Candidatus Woesebacteria bacterium]
MRIAIDISQIVYATGVSTYTKELVGNLIKIDKENEYVLFGGSLRRKKELREFIGSVSCEHVSGLVLPLAPTLADILWNKMHVYPLEKILGKVDVFHSSDWTQPMSNAYKVTTVHDLAYIKFPELTPGKISATHKRRLKLVKNEVDTIIVPSKQIESELMENGFDHKDIVVINEAASSQFNRVSQDEAKKIKKKYGKFILCVGVNPRKNTQRSLAAFNKLKLGGYKLLLVGQPHGLEVKETPKIRILGHVSDDELSGLYTCADVFLYPSLYEGFGIPILDAFKIGVPVVTSNVGCMREIAAGASVLVDPRNVDSIACGITKALKEKKDLIVKGFARQKDYSWEKMAKETLKVYTRSV